jgi:hypothetical protein
MSRAATGDVITEKPSPNVYTVLVAVAFLAQLLAFLAIYFKSVEIFAENKSLFS